MNRINWDDYFMAIAILTSKRSPDPSTQVGAVIVDENNHLISTGYNGPPSGISHSDVPWDNKNTDPLKNKYFFICHAEENAIYNSDSKSLKNSKLYCSLAPCCECAKAIIQTGIKEVVYLDDKHSDKPEFVAGKKLLDLAKIKHFKYTPNINEIVITF